MAWHKENEWEWNGKKFKVAPGQFVTSLEKIAKSAGVSIRNVRTALVRFEKLEFLTNESTKSGRLVTVVNWASYQVRKAEGDKDADKGVTKTRQRGDKGVTTNKNERMKECKNSIIKDIVEYMNKVCETKYKPTSKETLSHISARLENGFTLDDFKKVIDLKYEKWGSDPKMSPYLRPQTLFGTKFESYLNEVRLGQKGEKDGTDKKTSKYAGLSQNKPDPNHVADDPTIF